MISGRLRTWPRSLGAIWAKDFKDIYWWILFSLLPSCYPPGPPVTQDNRFLRRLGKWISVSLDGISLIDSVRSGSFGQKANLIKSVLSLVQQKHKCMRITCVTQVTCISNQNTKKYGAILHPQPRRSQTCPTRTPELIQNKDPTFGPEE